MGPFWCFTFLLQILFESHACPCVMLPAKQRSVVLANRIASGTCRNVNYVSKLFQPQNIIPKDSKVKKEDSLSKSQKVRVICFTGIVENCP